jgi:hypothetical protein
MRSASVDFPVVDMGDDREVADDFSGSAGMSGEAPE